LRSAYQIHLSFWIINERKELNELIRIGFGKGVDWYDGKTSHPDHRR
jgi:hypothetical protein